MEGAEWIIGDVLRLSARQMLIEVWRWLGQKRL